ncbi:hypothetical protein D3C71_1345210 [compost metagenome]
MLGIVEFALNSCKALMPSQFCHKVDAYIFAVPTVIARPFHPCPNLIILICLHGVMKQEGFAETLVVSALFALSFGIRSVTIEEGVKRERHEILPLLQSPRH